MTNISTETANNSTCSSLVQSAKAKVTGIVRSFLNNKSGSFVPIFAVSIFAGMASIGAAVDYTQISRVKTILNQAVDTAVLAAGNSLLEKNPTDIELRKIFDDHLMANLAMHPYITNSLNVAKFTTDRTTGMISALVDTDVPMSIMAIAGIDSIKVSTATEANFSNTPVEISMVLDVTGSMNDGGKLASLKLAAADAVDILLPSSTTTSNVRLGLVPYSAGVRLDNSLANIAKGTSTGSNCLTERVYQPTTDASYGSDPVTANTGASCSSSKVLPLTQSASDLKTKINAMTADGYTAGHLGVAWSYYMLSENWKNLWPASSKPANYNAGTKKIAILMTDGEFNTYFQGVPLSNQRGAQAAKSNADAIALCSDMKKQKAGNPGITIYSVAFNAPAAAKATLQACASDDSGSESHFFDATSETELRTAFRTIAMNIKTLRLTR